MVQLQGPFIFSEGTLAKLSKNENVSLEVLVKICRKLDCSLDEIVDILPEQEHDL